ncbi:MAG: putative glycolipid-binding domain-containing protein [Bacillota bacterium]|uniref:Glycolipid-binding domain-containing protein n=1 Tax=Virgibacillus salarius TaxID=447199 RepID=A0A941DWV4_9BACI|nr:MULTISPECIES: putative glycolipid-binding domain-containing protein [Bacillaceae]NAZ09507.1 hypothetical protein [Agaribacter marinus]MBR7796797.1 putative glycolipid-binding domain-containing protein [Virgibacillus salarius]MCC2250556.1 putative glycolipid-binding domain-containing protein [Virgibacillus sp. AGTR]MDY7045073.1 putative glycolipid-binding domain-containing protein [Virgibacillus sp. M23]QRZ19057.1 putative glycolipid-binding domain-containing protein [Virgibacillus sp. AGTR]
MDRKVIWEHHENVGTEFLQMKYMQDGIQITSTVINGQKEAPYLVHYQIELNRHWKFRELRAEADSGKQIVLRSNDQREWFNEAGEEITHLRGAMDIDLSCTPFTNSLPINRFMWETGQSSDFDMVFIAVPDFTLTKVKQRYHLVEQSDKRKVFNYKSNTFESTIEVDEMGIVTKYPGLFTRLYAK